MSARNGPGNAGGIRSSIEHLRQTGDPAPLLAAARQAPRHVDAPNHMGNDNRGPISAGESMDDVTAAWIAGEITDEQYEMAAAAAAGDDLDG